MTKLTPELYIYMLIRKQYVKKYQREPDKHERFEIYAKAKYDYKHASIRDKFEVEKQVERLNRHHNRPVYHIEEVPEDVGDFGRSKRWANRDHISRFNKHISTNKEWFVVTDKNMNVLSAQEGQVEKVNRRTRNRAYSEARVNLPEEQRDIYAFHSHPKHYGIATPTPSNSDIERLSEMEDGVYKRGLNIRGEGVMTTHGINVMRLEHDQNAQHIPKYYDRQLTIRMREEAKSRGITEDNFRTKSAREKQRLFIAGDRQAFSDTQQKYPELKTEFIKRDKLSRSDVRPHMVSSRHEIPTTTPNLQPSDVSSESEDVGDFGKRKKKKSKARRIFHGI